MIDVIFSLSNYFVTMFRNTPSLTLSTFTIAKHISSSTFPLIAAHRPVTAGHDLARRCMGLVLCMIPSALGNPRIILLRRKYSDFLISYFPPENTIKF